MDPSVERSRFRKTLYQFIAMNTLALNSEETVQDPMPKCNLCVSRSSWSNLTHGLDTVSNTLVLSNTCLREFIPKMSQSLLCVEEGWIPGCCTHPWIYCGWVQGWLCHRRGEPGWRWALACNQEGESLSSAPHFLSASWLHGVSSSPLPEPSCLGVSDLDWNWEPNLTSLLKLCLLGVVS